jgi:hypothetical protein
MAMPDKYKGEDVQAAYRAFYNRSKSVFARWKFCEPPEWYKCTPDPVDEQPVKPKKKKKLKN